MKRSSVRTSAASLSTVVVAVTAVILSATPAFAATWTTVATPNATSNPNRFNGVAALSSASAWAVGSADYATAPFVRPLAARWNGSTWSLVATPAVGDDATLVAVDGNTTTNVWAVGSTQSSTSSPLTERWNGSTWTVVPSPKPAGAINANLNGVKTLSGTEAWAVGDALVSGASPASRTLIMRWDGSSWTIVPSPSPDPWRNLLVAVDATATNDVWAVGNIGDDGYGGTSAGAVLRWNGSAWSRITVPGADATFSTIHYADVVAVSSNDVWVVGSAFHRQLFREVPYVLHYNGQGWQHGTITNAPSGRFNGVTALSATKVYAVGGSFDGDTLVARWDGTSWARESTPSPSGYHSLAGASATGTGIVWGVGTQTGSSGTARTLSIRTTNG